MFHRQGASSNGRSVRVIDPVELVKRPTPEPAATQATEQMPSADAMSEQP